MSERGRSSHRPARLLAVGAALALAALYALVGSAEPAAALRAFFLGPIAKAYSLFGLFEATAPLLVAALGACIAFKAGMFNLGGEGQAAVGALAAALVIRVAGAGGAAPLTLIAAALAAAALAGALLAALSAAAERWSGADVILTSFLFAQAALILVDWAIGGPLKASSSNLLAMDIIPVKYRLPLLAPPSSLSAAAPLALALAFVASLAFWKTKIGYETRIFGMNRTFALASGLDSAIGARALIVGGAFSGLAGGLLVLGPAGRAVKGMTGGIGWNGLSAALIAGSNPAGALPASLFLAWLEAGAKKASMVSDLSPDSSAVMKAVALFLITARFAFGAGARGRPMPISGEGRGR